MEKLKEKYDMEILNKEYTDVILNKALYYDKDKGNLYPSDRFLSNNKICYLSIDDNQILNDYEDSVYDLDNLVYFCDEIGVDKIFYFRLFV